jgi:hypothetical protein
MQRLDTAQHTRKYYKVFYRITSLKACRIKPVKDKVNTHTVYKYLFPTSQRNLFFQQKNHSVSTV